MSATNSNAIMTYAEYQAIMGSDISEDDFNSFIMSAQNVVELASGNFYAMLGKSIDEDPIAFRANGYKKAVAMQTSYMVEEGVHSAQALNDSPASWTIGKTSITKANAGSQKAVTSSFEGMSADAKTALMLSGAMSRGGVLDDGIRSRPY